MKIYLYNSFTTGQGYQYVELIDGQMNFHANVPLHLKLEFENSGCKIIFGNHANELFLLVKGLESQVPNFKEEEARRVYMNFAIVETCDKYILLNDIFVGLLLEWENVERYMSGLIEIFPDSQRGYFVSQERFQKLMNHLSRKAKDSNLSNLLKKIKGIPCMETNCRLLVCDRLDCDYKKGEEYYQEIREVLLMGYGVAEDSKITKILKRESFNKIILSPATPNYDEFVSSVDSQLSDELPPVRTETTDNQIEEQNSDTGSCADDERIRNLKVWLNNRPIVKISIIMAIGFIAGFVCARVFQ